VLLFVLLGLARPELKSKSNGRYVPPL